MTFLRGVGRSVGARAMPRDMFLLITGASGAGTSRVREVVAPALAPAVERPSTARSSSKPTDSTCCCLATRSLLAK